MPVLRDLKELETKYKDKGLAIVGVYIDRLDTKYNTLHNTIDSLGITWAQVVGSGAFDASNRYRIKYIPHLALIGKDGKLIHREISLQQKNNLDTIIQEALGN